MIRGTGYAALEIFVWLIAAGVIGLLIGWLLGRWSVRRRLRAEWQARFDAEHGRAESLDAELSGLRSSSQELESDLTTLRSRVEELESQTSATQDSTPADPAAGEEDDTHGGVVGAAAPETTSLAAIAARTRGRADPVDDELSTIPGVGPELEERLKQLGITSYRQVACLTPDDVVVVTEALGTYAGRIAHDNWMASAAAEHERKYGESL
ncbi:MAG TPA: hypothetical protein VLG28_14965 [Acidimicrobiia bacterium]|jgi:predicted flap endonuclease-1-like 5' DNA nuclease|nr:hypothetical protein [Acidimicrobiia bacterium]